MAVIRRICKTKTGKVRKHTKGGQCPVGTTERRTKVGKGAIKNPRRQTPGTRRSVSADRSYKRRAKPPGRRLSKSGRMYSERRQNRSDKVGTRL